MHFGCILRWCWCCCCCYSLWAVVLAINRWRRVSAIASWLFNGRNALQRNSFDCGWSREKGVYWQEGYHRFERLLLFVCRFHRSGSASVYRLMQLNGCFAAAAAANGCNSWPFTCMMVDQLFFFLIEFLIESKHKISILSPWNCWFFYMNSLV